MTAELSPVSRLFLEVMQGATAQDWIWLLKFDVLRKLVYWYDVDDASVHSPTAQQVEWPIIWILTRYHKKYLWCNSLPDLSWIAEDLSQWRNKVGWAWFFRNTPSKGYGFRPVRRQKTATCTVKLPDELNAWMNEMHRRIIVSLQHDMSMNRNYSNTLGVTKLGLQRLKHSKLAVIPTDKDGGYAIFERHNLRMVHEKILSSSAYVVCSGVDWTALKHNYCSLCKTVDRECGERGQLERQLLRSTRQIDSRVTCILGITVKSHKPNGLVKCRNLHKSKMFSFEGLSAWTEYEFKSQLKSCKHILRNSTEFVRKVAGARIPEGALLMRVDIEDFFMSGTVDELVSTTIPLIPRCRRNTVRKALTFLLNHQHVVSDLITERTYKVVKGTGMGLRHSGAVADASFFTLVEHDFVTEDMQDRLELSYGISHYFRFKDDIFFVAAQRTSGMEFFQLLQQRARHFKLKLEEISCEMVQMLDTAVYVENNSLQVMPHFKKTSLMRPLETSSAHSKGVHAWPLARLRALTQISSGPEAARLAHETYIRRFAEFLTPPETLQTMTLRAEEFRQSRWGSRNLQHSSVHGTAIQTTPTREKVRRHWIPLSYHPAWRTAKLQRLLTELRSPAFSTLLHKAFDAENPLGIPTISWKNRLRPTLSRISQWNTI